MIESVIQIIRNDLDASNARVSALEKELTQLQERSRVIRETIKSTQDEVRYYTKLLAFAEREYGEMKR